MKSNYKRLGDYIRQVDVRNKDEKVTRLLGVSIDKKFIESIANTIGTDMSVYKIVKHRQFAYGPVTSRNGDKVSIALLLEEECIISSSYTVFEITDTKKLLPEYLNLWFKRPEFDRYARFHSHGSAREIFDWEEMCNVELPVPPIEEQEKIVDAYQKIETRIALKKKINENLEAQAISFFRHSYEVCDENELISGTISDFGDFIRGKNLTAAEMCAGNIPVISAGIEPSGFHNIHNVKSPSITISGSGVNAGYVAYHAENIWASDCSYNNTAKYIRCLYLLLKISQSEILEMQKGTAQPHVYPKEINAFTIKYPPFTILDRLELKLMPLFDNIYKNSMEIQCLLKAKNVFLVTISGN